MTHKRTDTHVKKPTNKQTKSTHETNNSNNNNNDIQNGHIGNMELKKHDILLRQARVRRFNLQVCLGHILDEER